MSNGENTSQSAVVAEIVNPSIPRLPRFLSLRWRMLTPVFFVMLFLVMGGAYFVARNLSTGLRISQENLLIRRVEATESRINALYEYHLVEAQRIAFTAGFADDLQNRDLIAMETTLKTLLSLNNLDSVVLTDTQGVEIIGLMRAGAANTGERFILSSGAGLSRQSLLGALFDDAYDEATGFLSTPSGLMLYTGILVRDGDAVVGSVLVGQRLDGVLADLESSAIATISLYGPDGALLQTTLERATTGDLAISEALFQQIIGAGEVVPVQTLQLDETVYIAAYRPFNFGPFTLGAVAITIPDDIPFITETGRQLTAIFAAIIAGGVMITVFAVAGRLTKRIDIVTETASALAQGAMTTRTHLQPTDEVSAAGYALDQYAAQVQHSQDALQQVLRRQRRETTHLLSVLEALPGGVIVQDLEGRVVIINDHARALLGSQRVFRSAGIHELVPVVEQHLGPAIVPGVYMLGQPHRIAIADKMLSAQAAAVVAATGMRLGSVILLQDVTEHVQREREQDLLMRRLAQDIQEPLAALGRFAGSGNPQLIDVFAREVTRQSIALQKMLLDMRELTYSTGKISPRQQHAIALETLVWAVANEWGQVARANDLTLHVIIERRGLYVLGDEKRLRWAIGNLVDNAIKYNLPGGALTLEIKPEVANMANVRIRDNGVGISESDSPHVFTRFYRGTPTTAEGQTLRVPGMGQGLTSARQIIDAHGGQMQIRSKVGVGTATYIALPLTASMGMALPLFRDEMEGETIQLDEAEFATLLRERRGPLASK